MDENERNEFPGPSRFDTMKVPLCSKAGSAESSIETQSWDFSDICTCFSIDNGNGKGVYCWQVKFLLGVTICVSNYTIFAH